jgi:hypothetical protein
MQIASLALAGPRVQSEKAQSQNSTQTPFHASCDVNCQSLQKLFRATIWFDVSTGGDAAVEFWKTTP